MIAASRSRRCFPGAMLRTLASGSFLSLALSLSLALPLTLAIGGLSQDAARAAGDLDSLLKPNPEVGGGTGDVQPASLVAETVQGRGVPLERESVAGQPVPLVAAGGDSGAARGERSTVTQPPARPALSDWRVIAAIGAAFVLLASFKLFARRAGAAMPPPDVFEVLAGAPLAGQHAVRIVRFGPKTLLVGVSATGCTTLAEISDPQATARIAAACRGGQRPLQSPATRSGHGGVRAAVRVSDPVTDEVAAEPRATGDVT